MQAGSFEVDLVPAQIHDFSRSQAMSEGQEHHQSVTVTMPIALGRLDQPLDLVDGQMLPGAMLSIFAPTRGNCSIFSGWRDQTQVWFGHEKSPSRLPHCSIHNHFTNSF
jgi:hypothetical protein